MMPLKKPPGRPKVSCSPSGGRAPHRGGLGGRHQRGFTLIELVGILMIVGVLAAVAAPKFQSVTLFAQAGFRDQVIAALRYAGHTAMSHRRLVCASVSSSGVALSIAAANPATSCGTSLDGPAGGNAAVAPAGVTAAQTPTGTLYFQSNGRVTSDGAGATAANWSIAVTGESAITLSGETGHLQ